MTNLEIIRNITIDNIRPFDVLGMEALIDGFTAMWRCNYGGCPLHREDGETYPCKSCRAEIKKWLVSDGRSA